MVEYSLEAQFLIVITYFKYFIAFLYFAKSK